jgi:arylsulfatase A-like enzyme
LENIDMQIGRFLAMVEERGEMERTVIVYSSDHGEMLGDHDRWGKSTYYQPAVGVPLILAGPGIRSGAVSDALVSMHDLTATFLELAGAPPLPQMDSRSLVPVLRDQSEVHRTHVRSGLDAWRLVYDGRFKLVRDGSSSTLLFDVEKDPGETENVAADHPDVIARLLPLLP